MNLDITAELIRDLYEYGEYTGRPDKTGIVLTATGWDTAVWTTPRPPGPLALTAEDVYNYCGEYNLDDESAEALAKPEPPGVDYKICNEDGVYVAQIPDGVDPVVVTGHLSGELFPDEDGYTGEIDESWQGAWWFDRHKALCIIPAGAWDGPRRRSLYITEGGRYVMRTESRWEGEASSSWAEIPAEEAARWAYRQADDVEEDSPMLVVAAVAARNVLDSVAVPDIGYGDGREGRAWRALQEAIDACDTAGIIATLVRELLSADLRRKRGAAARIIVAAHGGNQTRAAELLGISQPTLHSLINQ